MIKAADRMISEGAPTEIALMKSAGEQSQGQACLQGFSSQYSHFSSSLRN